MSSSSAIDGSEDVNDFLRRLKELNEQRDREDAERTRKLEEDIIEGRKQREARRLERARSLSPDKSPTGTPSSFRSSRTRTQLENLTSSPLSQAPSLPPPVSLSTLLSDDNGETTSVSITTDDTANRPLPTPERLPVVNAACDSSPTEKSYATTRSKTHSWQQRPTPSTSPVPSSPLPASTKPTVIEPVPAEQERYTRDGEVSRAEIQRSLNAKDPAWFRQTPDRGKKSPAYRRNAPDEDSSLDTAGGRMRLHGLGKVELLEEDSELTKEAQAQPATKATFATRGLVGSLTPELAPSPLATHSSPLVPNTRSDALSQDNARPHRPTPFSRDRTERSQSPTKGMGGFVQSAMLRRNESMSKRWTASSTPSLYRQPSDKDTLRHAQGAPSLDDASDLSKASHPTNGRTAPTSSFNRPQSMYAATTQLPAVTPPSESRSERIMSFDTQPGHERTRSRSDLRSSNEVPQLSSPPSSPPKRWSPTKSSWLESALNKPEPSKPKLAVSAQPQWLSQLSKSRQQHGSSTVTDHNVSKPSLAPKEPAQKDSETGEVTPKVQTPPIKPKPTRLSDGNSKGVLQERSGNEPSSPVTEPLLLPSSSKTATTREVLVEKPERTQAPTSTDLRSTLRSPTRPEKPRSDNALEFQNAFGKLKKTKTENYVAPDVFKNNILRGKSALNVTDGPQKTLIKDEFKESLIQQRQSMKEKDPVFSSSMQQSKRTESAPARPTTPEAIAKRRALGKSDNSANLQPSPKSKPSIGEKPAILPVLPPVQPIEPKAHSEKSNGLAGRFNPALSALIAKGPSNASPKLSKEEPVSISSQVQSDPSPTPSGQLQHMTKNRARGPKRRAPKVANQSGRVEDAATIQPSDSSVRSTKIRPGPRTASSEISKRVQPMISQTSRTLSSPLDNTDETTTAPTTLGSKKDMNFPDTRQVKTSIHTNMSPRDSIPSPGIQRGALEASTETTQPSSEALAPTNLITSSSSATVTQHILEPLDQRPFELRQHRVGQSSSETQQDDTTRTKNNSKKSSPTDDSKSPNSQPSTPSSKSAPVQKPKPAEPQTVGTKIAIGSTRDSFIKDGSESAAFLQAEKSLSETFGRVPKITAAMILDASAVLSPIDAETPKVKTLQKKVVEISGDGKTISVPAQEEHILFDRAMYLCTHVFESETSGRSTDVYLWIGSNISDSAAEDVQIFAKRAAREVSGSLRVVRQGNEPAGLFQALGGIVVTRRGSNRDARRSYMLCGRRHLGHIAFDEVDLAPTSLCSGFIFVLASATSDRLFLWHGSGSSADEVGSARLISMDLVPTGEVTEVKEGEETPAFFSMFPTAGVSIPKSADHWKLKAKHDKYRVRLFNIESADSNSRPSSAAGSIQQVSNLWQSIRRPSAPDTSKPREISPFTQDDLEPDKIYVLDAFFEIYVIVGPVASRKGRAFATAVTFAQEYAILAASNDDRPFVPVGTVVLQGSPRDMKAAFRQWDDGAMKTAALMAGTQGKGLKILPLSAAVAAVRGT